MQYLINAEALYELLQANPDAIQLIDVRQPEEREVAHIGGKLIPLAELESALDTLNKNQPTIIYCKSGGRSWKALEILVNAGFKDVRHLEGGLLGYNYSTN